MESISKNIIWEERADAPLNILGLANKNAGVDFNFVLGWIGNYQSTGPLGIIVWGFFINLFSITILLEINIMLGLLVLLAVYSMENGLGQFERLYFDQYRGKKSRRCLRISEIF